MARLERTESRRARHSGSSDASPPMAAKSSTRSSVMNCGSIAIALSAEYGEDSCSGISLIGSMRSARCPACSSHAVIASRSPISPIPQLRADGMENNGTSIPARLVLDSEEVMRSCNGAAAQSPPQTRPRLVGGSRRRRPRGGSRRRSQGGRGSGGAPRAPRQARLHRA